jgi:hypothetical protein
MRTTIWSIKLKMRIMRFCWVLQHVISYPNSLLLRPTKNTHQPSCPRATASQNDIYEHLLYLQGIEVSKRPDQTLNLTSLFQEGLKFEKGRCHAYDYLEYQAENENHADAQYALGKMFEEVPLRMFQDSYCIKDGNRWEGDGRTNSGGFLGELCLSVFAVIVHSAIDAAAARNRAKSRCCFVAES